MKKRAAFSLLEACFACALLTGALLVVVALFHSSLRYGSRIEQEMTAAEVARATLAEVRQWCYQPANFEAPATYPGSGAGQPGFEVRVQLVPQRRDAPSTGLEAAWADGDRKHMDGSYLRTDVTVSWNHGRSTFFLSSLVGDPPRSLRSPAPLVLTGVPTELAPEEMVRVSAQAFDSSDRPLRDVVLRWSVRPIEGVATLERQARNGAWAEFRNRARRADGSYTLTGGTCRFAVQLIYRGQEAWGLSAPVTLLKT